MVSADCMHKDCKKKGQRLGRPLGCDSSFGLFGGRKLQSVSDIGPLCRLQVVLRIVENLPPKVSQLGLRFAIVVEGFKVYDYRAIVAVQFLVYIACLDDDPDFIIGYGVFGIDYTLHFVFTKQAFKKMGVCKKIMQNFYKSKKEILTSFWCSDINYIKKMYQVEYNRFKFFMES